MFEKHNNDAWMFAMIRRDPVSSCRPSFVDIMQQLSMPDTILLQSSEESGTSANEAKLGADLSYGFNLYTDLQNKYNISYEFS